MATKRKRDGQRTLWCPDCEGSGELSDFDEWDGHVDADCDRCDESTHRQGRCTAQTISAIAAELIEWYGRSVGEDAIPGITADEREQLARERSDYERLVRSLRPYAHTGQGAEQSPDPGCTGREKQRKDGAQ
jgi:hypothetical protein